MANQFEDLKKKVDELTSRVENDANLIQSQGIEIRSLRTKLSEAEIKMSEEVPAHFHMVDRINFKDLKGGLPRFNSTPTHVAEEGKIIVYSISDTSFYLGVKINNTWRKVQLSTIT